ncbi:MAG TPA: PDDEXK nuclease domain-containing protein [Verrucomicrobiota bacterium]|nr:DUF1016 domain-containing protein [Verrucomicrobiales bacterium]HRI15190.1 PDDEXK nuclease domain-containing protein [Verrucomicrobiota bacterium]
MKRSAKPTAFRRPGLSGYAPFLSAVKNRIRAAQVKATLAANAELIRLYWDIGRAVSAIQKKEGWGAGVVPRLARDIANDLPEVKGFSERNLGRMIVFAREYPGLMEVSPQVAAELKGSEEESSPPTVGTALAILPQAAAKIEGREIPSTQTAKLTGSDDRTRIEQLAEQVPWFHHVILLEKVKDLGIRRWYVEQTITHGWSRNILALQIKSHAHEHRGKAVHNFRATLPPPQSDLAEQLLKDPYIFDFLTLAEPFRERELEAALLNQVQKFLVELGQGFAFAGRQYHFEVGGGDFYLDLLFYHLHLRCFVVVDLKRGPFKAEYAGKMNFYCNVVDDRLRHAGDQPTIGIILCQDKNRIVAEYALKGVNKSIGISEYRLTRSLPKEFRSSLPTVEQMETELARLFTPNPKSKPKQK